MIKLSPRLEKISHYIKDNTKIIDIGCDHALLDIYLIKNRKNINIIASDINEKALSNAKKNLKKYSVENNIQLIQSNGLDNIDTTSLDTIVISGIGSHTIVGILYNNIKKLKNINTLIIQSNNDLDFLRYKITKIGYYIEDETLVKDNNIIYTIIIFKKGYKHYNRKELYFGPILLRKNDKLFIEKNKKELAKTTNFYQMIPKKNIHHRLITKWKIKNIKKIINK